MMIPEYLRNESSKEVTEAETAVAVGSGTLPVFATPAMVALMEETAQKSVIPYLESGQSTVGIQINVQHLRASKIGTILRCASLLTRLDGKKLFFEIEVFDDKGSVGKALHIRYLVSCQDFMDKLNA